MTSLAAQVAPGSVLRQPISQQLSRRPAAPSATARAAPGRIAVGGAISGSVDFGTGPVSALATDGFVVSLRP